ncbi:hypothetical protein IEQ34_002611 [Dendrobium chrysotoxum]|uniref:Uncharacterized protein n=1 Tax=Dendrobium chrysotoxum TaxID=161865 RepID=A0AAV7HHQ9_DENCH|nr:hypothetical protein IEQ34_002611 [Dendrobium chrysotoxum]
MKWRRMEELAEELKRSMVGWMRTEFPGVVRKVHGKKTSVTTQSGQSSLRTRSNGLRSKATAFASLLISVEEARDDAFSHPSGRPTAAKGKGMKWTRMEELAEELKRSMVGWMRAEFPGVVRKVTTAPRAAKSLAMSTMGSMWPGDKNGKKRMLRLWTPDPIVCLLIR